MNGLMLERLKEWRKLPMVVSFDYFYDLFQLLWKSARHLVTIVHIFGDFISFCHFFFKLTKRKEKFQKSNSVREKKNWRIEMSIFFFVSSAKVRVGEKASRSKKPLSETPREESWEGESSRERKPRGESRVNWVEERESPCSQLDESRSEKRIFGVRLFSSVSS